MTSLPDGLWMSAYLLSMKAIWLQEHNKNILFITLLLPFIAILTEILQYYSLFPGCFDWYDITNYTIPVIIYLISYYYEQKN